MSDCRFEFRVDEKLKKQFQLLAKKNKTTASKLLVGWIENYVTAASLTPINSSVDFKLPIYVQPEAIAEAEELLDSNESTSVFASLPVQTNNICPDTAITDFQRELAELKQELELLKNQYTTLDEALKASVQASISDNMQPIIASILNNLRTQYGWRSPEQDEVDTIHKGLDEKLQLFEVNIQQNTEIMSTQASLLQKIIALEKFAKHLGYKPQTEPKPKGKGFQP